MNVININGSFEEEDNVESASNASYNEPEMKEEVKEGPK